MKTHCPLKFFDNSDGSNNLYDLDKGASNPKVVVVIRNPFDTAVSLFNILKIDPVDQWQGSWEEFAAMFLQGMNFYSSFLEWYLPYWRILKSGKSQNLLFVKYENIVMHMESEVKRIAEFLGEALTAEQLEIIAHNCTFKNMSKEGENNPVGSYASKFFRKGEIGDHKNYFTPQQYSEFEDMKNALQAEGLELQYE